MWTKKRAKIEQVLSSIHLLEYYKDCIWLPIFQLQDDEYLAALQADREKELKAVQEAELRRAGEAAAREAALECQKKEEEEKLKKQREEEVLQLLPSNWKLTEQDRDSYIYHTSIILLAREHICLIKLQLGWANCRSG